MSHLQHSQEEAKEEFEELRGYDFDCLKDPEAAKKLYSCGLCEKLARKAVELSCPPHDEDLTISLYCETCLKSHLLSNNNLCPSTKHPNASYEASRSSRRHILSLELFCPNGRRDDKLHDNYDEFSFFFFFASLACWVGHLCEEVMCCTLWRAWVFNTSQSF